MKKTKYSEEQNAFALRQVETRTSIADVCRKMGICAATHFNWTIRRQAHDESVCCRRSGKHREQALRDDLIATPLSG